MPNTTFLIIAIIIAIFNVMIWWRVIQSPETRRRDLIGAISGLVGFVVVILLAFTSP